MNLKITINHDSTITEPTLSTIGCGIIEATFPTSFSSKEVNAFINSYLDENLTAISASLKSTTKEYRKKWNAIVESIFNEYAFKEHISFMISNVKIAYTKKLVTVTTNDLINLYDLKFNIDPMTSLLPDDVLNKHIRCVLLRTFIDIINSEITKRRKAIAFSDDSTDFKNKLAESIPLLEEKLAAFCKEFTSVAVRDEKSLSAFDKLTKIPFINISI